MLNKQSVVLKRICPSGGGKTAAAAMIVIGGAGGWSLGAGAAAAGNPFGVGGFVSQLSVHRRLHQPAVQRHQPDGRRRHAGPSGPA